jgi:hypothetical protein
MRSLSRALVAALILVSACDSGPKGPGTLNGEIQAAGTALGGAVLQVVGVGVDDFSGVGGSRVYWAPMTAEDSYRVIVIQDPPGDLRFQVSVQNVGDRAPTGVVVSLVSGQNLDLPVTNEYSVRFSR